MVLQLVTDTKESKRSTRLEKQSKPTGEVNDSERVAGKSCTNEQVIVVVVVITRLLKMSRRKKSCLASGDIPDSLYMSRITV